VDEQSIWKKEISFGRKRKETQPEPEETTAESSPSEPTSIWKKEISFGRRKKRAEAPDPAEDEAVAAAPEAVDASGDVQGSDPGPGPEDTAPDEQVWTRAVSFGRKHVDAPERVAEETVQVEAVADETEVAADASGDVQGSEPEPGPEEALPVPAEAVADEQEVVADASGDVQGSDPGPGPEETAAGEQVWTKEVSFSRTAEPEPVAAAPIEEVAAEAPTETWSAKPALPPEPEPVVVHPPVPAAELPPDPEQKVPFWKKELSFGGGKKREKAPKAARTPKEPKQPKERKQKQPKVKAARGARGAKRLVGLKVGASQLAAARVANNGAAELLQVAREPLEPGIVVGGELRDPEALADALKDFFAKHKLPKKGVRLGIANNRIGVRTFDIAGITDQKQLTNAIRFRAQETLPIPIDEAVLDYQVLGESVDEEGQPTKHILLVVAYRELIDRYIDACKKAGISLVGIDLEAFALLRALQAPQDGAGTDAGAALVAVAIGHERSTFAVSDGRVCEFTRVLEWGGSALNVTIARAVDAAPSEVEGAKRALALTDEMVPDGLTPDQAKKARDAMRRAIQMFARELVSSLQYYQNQPGSLGIGEIVLTGGTAHLPGLAGELERLIGVHVRVGDPLARMKVSKKLGETAQIGSLAVAIGLGIED
jgi:type IV pilus assembly protein PilM